jgi:hypothetical protein
MRVSDISYAANELWQLFGEDAVRRAILRADHSLARGDIDGFERWKEIAAAVAQLSQKSKH